MVTSGLRAAIVVVAGLYLAAPALANGQVENAMQLWLGDLRTNYNYTIQYVEAGNTDDGARYAATLAQQAEQLNQQVAAIQSASAALAPELGAAWSEAASAMSELSDAAETVAGQVGKSAVDIDDMESAFEEADDTMAEAWAFTKTFGVQYGALMSGSVENAKQMFNGAVTTHYNTTMQYIANENIAASKEEMVKLRDVTFKLAELAIDINNKAGPLARPLVDMWKPADDAIKAFQVEIGVMQSELGKVAVSVSRVEPLYGNLNSALVISHKDIMAFGERLAAISDDWR